MARWSDEISPDHDLTVVDLPAVLRGDPGHQSRARSLSEATPPLQYEITNVFSSNANVNAVGGNSAEIR
eukprot:5093564-Karenia_brevis.AAC.1